MYRGEKRVPSFLMFKADPLQWLLDYDRWKRIPLVPVVVVLCLLEDLGEWAGRTVRRMTYG